MSTWKLRYLISVRRGGSGAAGVAAVMTCVRTHPQDYEKLGS